MKPRQVKSHYSKLKLTISAQTGRRYVSFLRKHLKAAHGVACQMRAARSALQELSLVLVGDRRMGALHAQFLGIAGPTDVLTFPMETDPAGHVESGEVIVCVPEAARRAKIHKSSIEKELLLYSLHGMLHLLGYDDTTDRAFKTMHATEDAILKQIGIGPVFAPSASRAAASPRKLGAPSPSGAPRQSGGRR